MTPRFTVVPAPIEERIGEGLAHAAHEVLAMGARLKENVNDTLHDDQLPTRAAERMARIAVPTGAPFVLFWLFVAVYALRELLVRIETKRIIRQHVSASASVSVPTEALAETHEHRD